MGVWILRLHVKIVCCSLQGSSSLRCLLGIFDSLDYRSGVRRRLLLSQLVRKLFIRRSVLFIIFGELLFEDFLHDPLLHRLPNLFSRHLMAKAEQRLLMES